jgi:hypothetical protein
MIRSNSTRSRVVVGGGEKDTIGNNLSQIQTGISQTYSLLNFSTIKVCTKMTQQRLESLSLARGYSILYLGIVREVSTETHSLELLKTANE